MTVDAPPAFRGHTFDVTNPRGRFREVADSAGRRQRFGLVGADFRRRLPLLDRFQTIVDATHTGILTPDPRAYRRVLDGLSLEPGACVFVDDRRNVTGAQEMRPANGSFRCTQSPGTLYSGAALP